MVLLVQGQGLDLRDQCLLKEPTGQLPKNAVSTGTSFRVGLLARVYSSLQ